MPTSNPESEMSTHRECATSLRVTSMGRFPPRAVRRALQYIHANLAGDLRLENIASAAGQSVFHFSRTFRDTIGLAPHRYLTQARVERVMGLLLESELSLAAVADETGFSDQSHMSKVFRRLAGTTPKQYRVSGGVQRHLSPAERPRDGHSHPPAERRTFHAP